VDAPYCELICFGSRLSGSNTEYMRASQKSQIAFNLLPAVVIGGPPHSGKSVLAYSLTRALRERSVPHYLLRAYPPDYEGDWFQEGERELVRHLRLKGARSEAWLPLLRRDVARRHLPLIVDMGGLPTPEQEVVLNDCTHAVLLSHDEATQLEWEARIAARGLVLLANLRSDLRGENRLEQREPLLLGTLARLERGRRAEGPAFDALVTRLANLFTSASPGLRDRHLRSAPVELVVDIERLAKQHGWDPNQLPPEDLPAVLEYLPEQEPLALYGRGPNWLYSAVAVHAFPAPFFLFDVRLGWVEAPTILEGDPVPGGPLTVRQRPLIDARLLEFDLPDAYLDITEASELRLPRCPAEGAILSGKLPLWLWAGLARACDTPWVAVVQPQVEGAVVVSNRSQEPAVGAVVPVLPIETL
jgi:CRISPR-associated protein Csx3